MSIRSIRQRNLELKQQKAEEAMKHRHKCRDCYNFRPREDGFYCRLYKVWRTKESMQITIPYQLGYALCNFKPKILSEVNQ